MKQQQKAVGCIAAAVVWVLILFIAAGAYKFAIQPFFAGELENSTGSESPYDHDITLALDSFSGYAVLRSPAFAGQLKSHRIRLNIQDDKAGYTARMKALQEGAIQFAAFTVDSYLSAGAALGEYPGTIILIIDETRGADAIVAKKQDVATIQDLDHPEARFVLTPDSPSEFLARIVLAGFSLPSLPQDCWEELDGAEAVFNQLRASKGGEKRAYVLWEPYVSKALADPAVHILLDSSKLQGYIVDVLVVERRFLAANPAVAATVIESYLRTLYSYQSRDGAMQDLLLDDGKKTGVKDLSKEQAAKLVDGIRWKNTVENFGHFGLDSEAQRDGAVHMEDMIANILRVLLQTGAIQGDPVGNMTHTLYYDQILRGLQSQDFHPARTANVIQGVDGQAPQESVATQDVLPELSEPQWAALAPVGELRMEPISFARGTARINIQSQRDLEELSKRLQAFPRYYLKIIGHARAEGDSEANLQLATERANAAMQVLLQFNVAPQRIHTEAQPPRLENGSAQSVSFQVGQPPY
ncbi:MAG: OmpA family protein [Candidatus Hydrogenedentes bacterium]|nr:OmpA family protein [Candidatus Hydrogenedentota bacterium]